MDLTITLTPQEEADIHGWVNFYLAHPEQIGTPQQTKIVLESQTRERFEQIAAQFSASPGHPIVLIGPPIAGGWVGPIPATGQNFDLAEVAPGILYRGQAGGAGRFSASVSSGMPVLIWSVNQQDYVDPAPCQAGDTLTIRLKDGMAAAAGCKYSIVP